MCTGAIDQARVRVVCGAGSFETCAVESERARSGNEGLPADVIRTPDRRLRVFVSSTLGELAEERQAVSRAITALRLTPVMFEVGARPHPPQELYRAYLAQSDVFIGLYWQRYGWVGPGMEISGLEDEFQLSRAFPRLLYVKGPAPDREPAPDRDAGPHRGGGLGLLPSLPHPAGAGPAGTRRPGHAAERAVRRRAPLGRGRGAAAPARAAPAAGGRDLAGRAGARPSRRWPVWPGAPTCGW